MNLRPTLLTPASNAQRYAPRAATRARLGGAPLGALALGLGLLAACGSSEPSSPVPDAGAPPDAASPPRSDAGPAADAEPVADGGAADRDAGVGLDGPGVVGVVLDEAGAPIANTMVLGCTLRFCLYASSDADGRFVFEVEPPVTMVVKTPEDETTMPARGEGIQPLELTERSALDVGNVYVPSMPERVPLGPPSADPQTLMIGDGLTVVLRRADLQAPVGKRANSLAARAVEPARQPRFSALAQEEIVAVYALAPFATTSRSPIGVKLPTSLPMGTAVKLRTVDELDGHLSDPVAATSDGAFITTAPDTGITKLSWLVVSR